MSDDLLRNRITFPRGIPLRSAGGAAGGDVRLAGAFDPLVVDGIPHV